MSDGLVLVGGELPHVPSEPRPCSTCGRTVYVSIATGLPVLAQGAIPMCLACALDKARAEPDAEFAWTDNALAEAVRALARSR